MQEPGRLLVFAPDGSARLGAVEVGRFPRTTTSARGRAHVSAVADATVTVVDLERLAVLDTLHVDRRGEPGAHGLAYVPGCGCLGS
ncbi:hypothetical protein [Saccharopolyspora hordei]|uniref:Uncharacterized protein n=1 Tax=Saccharopolyspora hordei TaxID=1838 RepID=A0A853AQ59_9PSEU|nr:hypothetical protein [Saccharopolyspora hordei]NYI82651.1 hypothetical protein [Saccharopolyspora hordei]